MPANRFLYPSCGHSAKVTSLTDLEFRVWTQYLLSADDFGVMRLSAITAQADNDALASKPAKTIQRCLDRLVSIGLVRSFKHQDRTYIYQHDWQKYQNIRYPRQSHDPMPPANLIAACDESTRNLFAIKARNSGKPAVEAPEDFGDISEIFPSPARAGGRETLTLTANANSPEMRAGDFIERYKAMHVRLRKGAHYIGRPTFDFQEAMQLVAVYDDARLDKLAFVWLNTDHDFAQNGTRTLAKFRSMASWCEEQLIEWESKHGPLEVAS